MTIAGATWRAEGSLGSGMITVSEFVPSYMAGSFELSLVGGPSQTTLEVTRGRLEIIG